MNVKVKGVNDYLYFELDSHVAYNFIMDDLKSILNNLPESVQGYYPKAFFDFKDRILSENNLKTLLILLEKSKKVIFGGMKIDEKKRKMKLIEKDIYNGEIIEEDEDILIIGNVHYGAIVKNTKNTYIIGKVLGNIEGLCKNSTINFSNSEKANIRIFNQNIQNVTISSLSLFYYKEDQIKIIS